MTDESRLSRSVCPTCGGSGVRSPDGLDSMGLPRWGAEGLDNRVDRRCRGCGGSGRVAHVCSCASCQQVGELPPVPPLGQSERSQIAALEARLAAAEARIAALEGRAVSTITVEPVKMPSTGPTALSKDALCSAAVRCGYAGEPTMSADPRVGRLVCWLLGHCPALVTQPCRCLRCGAMIKWDDKGGWRYA